VPDNVDSSFVAMADELNVSRETLGLLSIYQALLVKWQKKTNLVAPSTIDDYWIRHVADSIQCRHIKPDARHWVDIGSGGGFPGLVVAADFAGQPDHSMVLVESNAKKCAFLREVSRKLGLGAEVVNDRIENYIRPDNAPDVVTARALSNLNALLSYCEPWISAKCVGLFHKGREYRREIEDCYDKWQFDLIEHRSKVSEESVILEISNLTRRHQD